MFYPNLWGGQCCGYSNWLTPTAVLQVLESIPKPANHGAMGAALLLQCVLHVTGDRPPDFRGDPAAREALLAEVEGLAERILQDDDDVDDLPVEPQLEEATLLALRHALALGLIQEHRYEEATSELHAALQSIGTENPNVPQLRYNLGVALSALRRHHEAQEQYQIAIQGDPQFASAHFNLARTHMALANDPEGDFWIPEARQQRLRKAEDHLTQAMFGSVGQEECLKSLEEVYYQLGHQQAAFRSYSSMLSLKPQLGLKVRKPQHCEDLRPFLEDRLLQFTAAVPGYPRMPHGVLEDLCGQE
eukprot:s274_g18.t2